MPFYASLNHGISCQRDRTRYGRITSVILLMVVEQMKSKLSSALGYKGKHNLSSINDKMLHQ